jgi:hypothetical protein
MIQVFSHQNAAFRELLCTAKTYFSGAWQRLPITPRFNRLIIGESGSGKSFLARALAEQMQLPIWNGTATNWIPLGCSERGARPTWVDIADFIATQKRGIIFIDELDKLGTDQSPWMRCVRVETFALIDRQVPVNLILRSDPWEDSEEKPELSVVQEKLLESVLILAAGAFQGLWEDAKPSIGFTEEDSVKNDISYRKLAETLPTELVNRFAPPPIVIPTLERRDYEDLLASSLERLDSEERTLAEVIGRRTLESAVSDRLGCRWIEQIMLETAKQLAVRHSAKVEQALKTFLRTEKNIVKLMPAATSDAPAANE